MTAQDWIDLLPIVADRGWHVRLNDQYIRDRSDRCPICALAHEVDSSIDEYTFANRAAARVFDTQSCVPAIMNAADSLTHPLRPALMHALGMQ